MASVNSASEISARIAPHLVKTVRHLQEGVAAHDRLETVVTLTGPSAEIANVRRVALGRHSCRLDHLAGVIRHAEHADPLVTFSLAGLQVLQVFFHDLHPQDADATICIETDAGASVIDVRSGEAGEAATIETTVRISEGKITLEVRSDRPVEIIEQRTVLGVYSECRRFLPAGFTAASVDPGFADVLGIVVSSLGVEGGFEHKHQILGRFGYPSGRVLLRDGKATSSGQTQPHGFRSAIAVVSEDGMVGGMALPWAGMDEIEVWARPPEAAAAAGLMSGCPIPWRLMTYGPIASRADVTVLEPHEGPLPGQPFSYCLFGNPRNLASSLATALLHRDVPGLIERPWLVTEEPPEAGALRYGIAWQTHDDEIDRVMRSRMREIRHRAIGLTRTDRAAAKSSCLPVPHPGGEDGFAAVMQLLTGRQPLA